MSSTVRPSRDSATLLISQPSSTWDFTRFADAFEAVNGYYHIDTFMRYINETLGVSVMPYQYTTGVQFDPHGLNGADNSHYISSTGRIAWGEGGVDDSEDPDVILHELVHTRVKHHGPRFWEELERHVPDCRRVDKELGRYEFMLAEP